MNIPCLSVLKEMLPNNYSAFYEQVPIMQVNPRTIYKLGSLAWRGNQAFNYTKMHLIGPSLRYQVPKILPILSTLYILERVTSKICIHLSQFSETTALCFKNISIMASIMPDAPDTVLCSKLYASIIRQTLVWVCTAYSYQELQLLRANHCRISATHTYSEMLFSLSGVVRNRNRKIFSRWLPLRTHPMTN